MIKALLLFVAQYMYVVLLGLQSLNVNSGHRVLAGICSALLGMLSFPVIAVIGSSEMSGVLWAAFVASGPAGIVTSMWLHPHLSRWYNRVIR